MLITIIASTISWIPPIQRAIENLTPNLHINWFGILFPIVLFGFAVWTIMELCKKLEAKPELFITYLGVALLAATKNQPRRVEYFYKALFVNSSPEKTLGIIDIRLVVKYKSITRYIPPYLGIPKDDFGRAEKGEIPSNMLLQPNESKEGTLAFVDELTGNEGPVNASLLEDAKIVIMTAQRREYTFSAAPLRPVTAIISRGNH
jgi:hypothetical protein